MRNIGSAAETALTQAGPPATPGKSFWIGAPSFQAWTISEGVWHPGAHTILLAAHHSTTSGISTGLTINCAPASKALLASSTVITVPTPVSTSFREAYSATESRHPGVVSVNSTSLNPPSTAAFIAGVQAPTIGVRRTAHALCSANCFKTD